MRRHRTAATIVIVIVLQISHLNGISAEESSSHTVHSYGEVAKKATVCLDGGAKKSLLLWSIDSPKQKVRSFLFGTIHVSYDEVWEYVSDKVKQAFAEAESVVFELELHNPNTIEVLLQCKNLGGDQQLKDLIPHFVYDRLKHYMRRFKYRLLQWAYRSLGAATRTEAKKEAKRLYSSIAGDWELKRPVWLLFLLYQMSESSTVSAATVSDGAVAGTTNSSSASHRSSGAAMEDEFGGSPMLDVFLAQKAQELGKRLHSIETPAEQCNPLFSINHDQIVFAINYTLSYLEWLEGGDLHDGIRPSSAPRAPDKSGLTELVEHYRCGSLEASVFSARRFVKTGFTISPESDWRAKQIDGLLVDDIILKRNIRMAIRADILLRQSPSTSFFFALGAGHFLGEKSLISALESYGYSIAPVTEDDDIISYLRANTNPQKFNELWVRDLGNQLQLSTINDQSKSLSGSVSSSTHHGYRHLLKALTDNSDRPLQFALQDDKERKPSPQHYYGRRPGARWGARPSVDDNDNDAVDISISLYEIPPPQQQPSAYSTGDNGINSATSTWSGKWLWFSLLPLTLFVVPTHGLGLGLHS